MSADRCAASGRDPADARQSRDVPRTRGPQGNRRSGRRAARRRPSPGTGRERRTSGGSPRRTRRAPSVGGPARRPQPCPPAAMRGPARAGRERRPAMPGIPPTPVCGPLATSMPSGTGSDLPAPCRPARSERNSPPIEPIGCRTGSRRSPKARRNGSGEGAALRPPLHLGHPASLAPCPGGRRASCGAVMGSPPPTIGQGNFAHDPCRCVNLERPTEPPSPPFPGTESWAGGPPCRRVRGLPRSGRFRVRGASAFGALTRPPRGHGRPSPPGPRSPLATGATSPHRPVSPEANLRFDGPALRRRFSQAGRSFEVRAQTAQHQCRSAVPRPGADTALRLAPAPYRFR
jgi:hypothetical protein